MTAPCLGCPGKARCPLLSTRDGSMSDAAPVLIEVWRGGMVESRHRGAYALVDADGDVIAAQGDIERPVYARSAIKPLQALPLIETGAAESWKLSDEELAIAC